MADQHIPAPVGAWYSTVTFPAGQIERSILRYGQDGSVTESSTRFPTRLAGIGQWRSTAAGRFEAFENFLFPAGKHSQELGFAREGREASEPAPRPAREGWRSAWQDETGS